MVGVARRAAGDGRSRYGRGMTNDAARDLLDWLVQQPTASRHSLYNTLAFMHSPRRATDASRAALAPIATLVEQIEDILYLDVELGDLGGPVNGSFRLITRTLLISGEFTVPANLYDSATASATAYSRAGIRSVTVSDVPSVEGADKPWPTGVDVLVEGDDWQVRFPRRRARGAELGKLIPTLLT